uniref:Uncharacterized protein n=1 Tax=Tanacetum cinerariifolium TaxID=118510 RepID=A0A6L2KYD6_TANCI|nr:hypothetical protein [Tanacetum cinerariifolium]
MHFIVTKMVGRQRGRRESEGGAGAVEKDGSKESREIEEAYTQKDGVKNAFHRDEDGEEAERKKRKRTTGRSSRKRRFKGTT